MYKTIYTVSNKYKNKKIYIYGINRDSVSVFTDLAFRDTDVAGFCEDRFDGQMFMNRPIISEEKLIVQRDAIIILHEEIEKGKITNRFDRENVFYVDEILDLNQDLKNEDIYIYGIGKQGEEIYKLLLENGIEIKGGCVSQKKDCRLWHDKSVVPIEEIKPDCKCSIIIATVLEANKRKMLKNIEGYSADKYVNMFMESHIISEGTFFQVINKAINEKRDVFLYGSGNDVTQIVERTLQRYHVNIKGRIYEREMQEQNIHDIYDLAYEDIDNFTVVIAEQDRESVEQVSDILDSLGFGLEKWDYTSVERHTLKVKDTIYTEYDCLLGGSYNYSTKYPGYVVLGNDNEDDIKILVLGGSTSVDGELRTVSWVRVFYNQLVANGYHVTIYNGAISGHDVVQEFLLLCRDGEYLRPDYVISFSGVNNTMRKKVKNQFCARWFIRPECISGIEGKESLYDFWYKVIKLMKAVSDIYGSRFFSFLQPMYESHKELGISEFSMYEMRDRGENTTIYRMRSKEEKNALYTNLIDLFDEKGISYIDSAHYSNEMNKIIANAVYETILAKEGNLKKIQGDII